VTVPAETEWVKYVKIRASCSRVLGRPMYLGAVVLLPQTMRLTPISIIP